MTRLQKTAPWCAVIAATQEIALQYMDAFGLSSEIWRPMSHGDALLAHVFDRIVVIRPHWRMCPIEIEDFEENIQRIRLRVSQDGHFKVI
jgi:hypothetical protein